MKKKKVLLIDPSYEEFYSKSDIHLYKAPSKKNRKTKVPYNPVLGLATLGAVLLNNGCKVKILDMNLPDKKNALLRYLKNFEPDYVGVTFVSGLFNEMKKITEIVKGYDNKIVLFGGGSHATAFPDQTLKESLLDLVVVGEAEETIIEVVNGKKLSQIKGISYKKGKKIIHNPKRELIKDLDTIPFPAWKLYDIKRYRAPKIIARKAPAGWIETSRGCVWGCIYCTKSTFGRKFRAKSVKRVVDEIEYMLRLGFKEIQIADDAFSTDMQRAKKICDEILKRGLKFPWTVPTGIRVDQVDSELLRKMKKAGCYRVYYGIESGNQKILDRICKGINIVQVRKAVKLAKKAGLEVIGYFMLGLPDETPKTMQQTINFAKSLDLDLAKTTIASPLPATKMYEEYEKKGLVHITDWGQYNLYMTPKDIYDHPTLSWSTVEKYNKKFYRDFYLRPSFILKRLYRGIVHGTLITDVKQALSTHW